MSYPIERSTHYCSEISFDFSICKRVYCAVAVPCPPCVCGAFAVPSDCLNTCRVFAALVYSYVRFSVSMCATMRSCSPLYRLNVWARCQCTIAVANLYVLFECIQIQWLPFCSVQTHTAMSKFRNYTDGWVGMMAAPKPNASRDEDSMLFREFVRIY